MISLNDLSEDFLQRPILIVGTMRSGTTLLGRILNNHLEISVGYYQTNLLRDYGIRFDPISKNKNAERLVDTIRDYIIKYGGKFSEEKKEKILSFLEKNGYSYQKIYYALSIFLNEARIHSRWGEKYAGDCRDVEYFINLFPRGQVIQIIRDPRDVYSSTKKRIEKVLEKYRRDLCILENWKKCYCSSNYFSNKYGKETYLVIQYENLIRFPQKETKKICDFLGVSWTKDMINPKKFLDGHGTKWSPNTSFDKLKGLDTSSISRYKKYVSQEELAFIEEYLKNEFSEMEMELSGCDSSRFPNVYENYVEMMHNAFFSLSRYRIAFFVNSLKYPFSKKLAELLYQLGMDLVVFTYEPDMKNSYNYTVKVLQKKKSSSRKLNWNELKNKFSCYKFDFIHLDGSQSFDIDLVLKLQEEFNIKILMTNGTRFDNSYIDKIDKIISNTQDEQEYYENIVKNKSKISLIEPPKFFNNLITIYRSFLRKHQSRK